MIERIEPTGLIFAQDGIGFRQMREKGVAFTTISPYQGGLFAYQSAVLAAMNSAPLLYPGAYHPTFSRLHALDGMAFLYYGDDRLWEFTTVAQAPNVSPNGVPKAGTVAPITERAIWTDPLGGGGYIPASQWAEQMIQQPEVILIVEPLRPRYPDLTLEPIEEPGAQAAGSCALPGASLCGWSPTLPGSTGGGGSTPGGGTGGTGGTGGQPGPGGLPVDPDVPPGGILGPGTDLPEYTASGAEPGALVAEPTRKPLPWLAALLVALLLYGLLDESVKLTY